MASSEVTPHVYSVSPSERGSCTHRHRVVTVTNPPDLSALSLVALEELPDAVLIHDLHTIMYANRAAREILKASARTQIEGAPLEEWVHADARTAGAQRRRLVLEQGHALTGIATKLIAADGTLVYAMASARRIEIDGQPAIVVVGRPMLGATDSGR